MAPERTTVVRPGQGTRGRPMNVLANHFKVDKIPDFKVSQWAIDFTEPNGMEVRKPDIMKFLWNTKEVQDGFEGNHVKFVYNGRSLAWSPADVKLSDDFSIKIEIGGISKRLFHLRVRRVIAEINLAVLSEYANGKYERDNHVDGALGFIDVLINQTPKEKFTSLGHNFFSSDPKTLHHIDAGLVAAIGFFQSARFAPGGLTINVDTSATVFHESGNIVPILGQFLGARRPSELSNFLRDERYRRAANRFLKNLSFTVSHRGAGKSGKKKVFRIHELAQQPADRDIFEMRDGDNVRSVSVADYFNEKYQIALEDPGLPCVQTKSKIKFPLQVMVLEWGQKYGPKLNGEATANMIKAVCMRPADRIQQIRENIRSLDWGHDPHLQQNGMRIQDRMLETQARVLPAPELMYHPSSREGERLRPQGGRWNLRGRTFVKGKIISSWAVAVLPGRGGPGRPMDERSVRPFISELTKTLRIQGIQVDDNNPSITVNDERWTMDEFFTRLQANTQRKPDLLLFLVKDKTTEPYSTLKRICDTKLGIPSQVCISRHVQAAKTQYCANVAMKINAKLGGANVFLSKTSLPVRSEPTILLGADVSHPGIGSTANSVASLVGSIDPEFSRYAGLARNQASRQEMISDIGSMAKQLLRLFYRSVQQKPGRIIYFRDGVSEGQYAQVLDTEMSAILAACNEIEAGYKPKITVCIARKRHHTRFFPANPRDGDKNANIIPGTLVDTGAVHPVEYDFFLSAHSALQGTARPTHYHVIHDEIKMSVDDFQQMVHDLCYIYQRATTSISICAPVYYAHLVGRRAKCHDVSNVESESASMVSGDSGDLNKVIALPELPASLKDKMWYL